MALFKQVEEAYNDRDEATSASMAAEASDVSTDKVEPLYNSNLAHHYCELEAQDEASSTLFDAACSELGSVYPRGPVGSTEVGSSFHSLSGLESAF